MTNYLYKDQTLKGFLPSKKLGLVWDKEREKEKIVEECKENLPVLNRLQVKELLKTRPKQRI